MYRFFLLSGCLALGSISVAAQATGASAQQSAQARVEASLQELSQLRQETAEQKQPLSREVSDLQEQLVALEGELAQLRRVHDSRDVDLATLRRQVDQLRQQNDFIDDRLREYVGNFSSWIHYSEIPLYEEAIAQAELAPNNVNLSPPERREAQLQIVQTTFERLDHQQGGYTYTGEALSEDGLLHQGTFWALGPTVYFASADGKVSGIVEKRLNSNFTTVVPIPGTERFTFTAASADNAVAIPLDPTNGRALRIATATKSIGEYVEDGGPIGYVIIVLGTCAILLALFKIYDILRLHVERPKALDEILEQLDRGDSTAALKRAQQVPGRAGEIMVEGVHHYREPRELLEELLYERVLHTRPTLERFLPFLSLTAAAAPLLGLLGTVVGMIKTFNLITIFGTGDAKSLSSGISEALVTTALGLIVAIPVLLIHGALSRMAKRRLGLLEQTAVAFLNGAELLKQKAARQPHAIKRVSSHETV
ncbi:MAG: MotA/TolQ/ExbB proton channel family protein [Verrucomicrobiota bacterium JB022]|nr:MotA/TolQ/ExbB proton channel family protein [Verrucomicrobiota bacterium JB022]